jgi:putative membrane protein
MRRAVNCFRIIICEAPHFIANFSSMRTALVHWLAAAVALLLTSRLVPGFVVTDFGSAFFAAAVVGLLNVVVWPLLAFITFPLTIFTFGLFLLVVNGIVLMFGSALTPGFHIVGLVPAIIGSIVLSLVGWFVRLVFRSALAV